jgi:hypothetical protein
MRNSDCCDYPSDEDMGICFRCGEHCEFLDDEEDENL